MPEINIQQATDEELEAVLRKAENTHVSGSQFEIAQTELEIRRKRKLFEIQEKLLLTLQSRLDRIINVLSIINKRPLLAATTAATGAILIGVSINLISALITHMLGWQ